jgi:hypothetical protein
MVDNLNDTPESLQQGEKRQYNPPENFGEGASNGSMTKKVRVVDKKKSKSPK